MLADRVDCERKKARARRLSAIFVEMSSIFAYFSPSTRFQQRIQ